MALIQVNFMSKALLRTVTVNVILPVDKFSMADQAEREDKPYKTLYLLHGIFGNYTDWVTGTDIVRLAQARDLAVVMPSGENGFYLDQPDHWRRAGEYYQKNVPPLQKAGGYLYRRPVHGRLWRHPQWFEVP